MTAGLAQRQLSSTDRRARLISVTPARERQAFVDGLERLVGGRLATPVQCDRPVRRPRGR